LGHQRKWPGLILMSALPPRTDIASSVCQAEKACVVQLRRRRPLARFLSMMAGGFLVFPKILATPLKSMCFTPWLHAEPRAFLSAALGRPDRSIAIDRLPLGAVSVTGLGVGLDVRDGFVQVIPKVSGCYGHYQSSLPVIGWFSLDALQQWLRQRPPLGFLHAHS
jgi:hypothetical protein